MAQPCLFFTMKLLRALLLRTGSRMDVVVEDDDGHRRNIVLTWHRKDDSCTPPRSWEDQVKGEVSIQRSEELAKSQGKWIPTR